MKILASLALTAALSAPPIIAAESPTDSPAAETPTSREHAPDTDDCHNAVRPPEPRTTSEVPQPGAEPTYPPVCVDGRCGECAPQGIAVTEEVHGRGGLVAERGGQQDGQLAGARGGLGFDEAALDAARRTTFQAATKNGVRVKMWTNLNIRFTP